MTQHVSLQKTLVYYDAPQLFVAIDPVGTKYLCLVVEQQEDQETCFCVPISPRRLAELELGNEELREIYRNPEIDARFVGSITDSYDTISLEPLEVSQVREEWLPDPGFYFEKQPENTAAVQKAASAENKAAIEVDVNPPEARAAHRISPSHLVDVLESFQLVIKYAYRKAINALDGTADDRLKSPFAHALNVSAFSPASFKIHFESQQSADMFGHVHLSMALEKLDELTRHVDDPEKTVEVMRQNRGHLATAYLRLLEGIIKNDAPFSYTWSMPNQECPVTRSITKKQAIPLHASLSSQSELTRVERDIEGYVVRASWNAGTWTIRRSDTGKEVSGQTHEESQQDLTGVVLNEKKYVFHCLETIEETVGTGRKSTRLFMLYYREA